MAASPRARGGEEELSGELRGATPVDWYDDGDVFYVLAALRLPAEKLK